MPLLFVDKQVLAITIDNAFLAEADRVATPFTHCEIYPGYGFLSQVPRPHMHCAANTPQIPANLFRVDEPVTFIDEVVVDVLSFHMRNYYHFMAEMVPRSGLNSSPSHSLRPACCWRTSTTSPRVARREHGGCCRDGCIAVCFVCAVIYRVQDELPYVWVVLDMLGLALPGPPIEYSINKRTLYVCMQPARPSPPQIQVPAPTDDPVGAAGPTQRRRQRPVVRAAHTARTSHIILNSSKRPIADRPDHASGRICARARHQRAGRGADCVHIAQACHTW